jgi:hypothetical protein
MTKYYINLILLLVSILGFTSINNLEVVATDKAPNVFNELYISEIAYDTKSLEYNQKCQPTDAKASCSFDKWFEIYNPSPVESIKLSDILFSVNNGKNLNSITSSDLIPPQGYAVVHNSRVASGVIDTFKVDRSFASGKSGWIGSISGQRGDSYNVNLEIYYKNPDGIAVLINARNISGLTSNASNLKKTIEFKSPDHDYTYADQSFIQIGESEFYGSPFKGLNNSFNDDPQQAPAKQPIFVNSSVANSQTQPKQLIESLNQPITARSLNGNVQTVPELNAKYLSQSGLNAKVNLEIKKIKEGQLDFNLNLQTDQILAKSIAKVTAPSIAKNQSSFNNKINSSAIFTSYSYTEIIFLDVLILTLVGLKLITRSKVLKFKFSQKTS